MGRTPKPRTLWRQQVPLAAYGQGRRLWAASRPLLCRGWVPWRQAVRNRMSFFHRSEHFMMIS